MPRQGPVLQRVASVLAIASFGLMFLAGARLLLSGPVMQRVLANIPQPFERRDDAGDEATDADAEQSAEGAGGAPVTGASPADEDVADLADRDLAAATAPGLRVKKIRTSADSVLVGEIVEFEISVQNIGDLPLTEVGVSDVFDTPYLAFVDAEPPPARVDEVGGRIEWSGLGGGPILPGERTVVRARFEAIAAAPAPYRPFNAARASAREQNLTDGPSIAVVRIEDPASLCLGDLVFQELIDDGRFEPADGDQGIAGVALTLYGDADGDGRLSADDVEIARTVSDAAGRYAFCDLSVGGYVVAVDAANFEAGRPLAQLQSSRAGASVDMAGDPNDDVDHDDNGAAWLPAGDVADAQLGLDPRTVTSRAIELSAGDEPGEDRDGDDRNKNSTLDFGFVLPREPVPQQPESPDRVQPPVERPVEPEAPDEPDAVTPPDEPEAGITGGPERRPGKPVHGKPLRRGDRSYQGGAAVGALSLQGRGCAHVVVGGETVDGIAWAHGLSPWSLAAHNKLVHPGLLRVGQVLDLCVPGP